MQTAPTFRWIMYFVRFANREGTGIEGGARRNGQKNAREKWSARRVLPLLVDAKHSPYSFLHHQSDSHSAIIRPALLPTSHTR
jgi:hypothetical protein